MKPCTFTISLLAAPRLAIAVNEADNNYDLQASTDIPIQSLLYRLPWDLSSSDTAHTIPGFQCRPHTAIAHATFNFFSFFVCIPCPQEAA
jgi:hypothetical protein